jgi:hypothetical protein
LGLRVTLHVSELLEIPTIVASTRLCGQTGSDACSAGTGWAAQHPRGHGDDALNG